MTDPNATPRRVRAILRRLERRFGPLTPPRAADPLDELILTVLSQHTSDVNADRAFTSLRDAFPTWGQVVAAPEAALADAIRSGGLANTKAHASRPSFARSTSARAPTTCRGSEA
jgi:endonuclease-3